MINLIPPEILAIIGAVVSLIVTFVVGRHSGKQVRRTKEAERDRDAAIARKEKNNEIENLPPDKRDARLKPWVRKSK